MNDDFEYRIIQELVQDYLEAKKSGKLGTETHYGERMERCREWQRTNILDYNKLTGYSDEDFVQIFGKMFDNSDGSDNSHNLARGMHFGTAEKRLEARTRFEKMVKYIIDNGDDRFRLLEEIMRRNSPFKVMGLGEHIVSTLINALYIDVPLLNATTREFFRNIGKPLFTPISEQQLEVRRFSDSVVASSRGLITSDDVNLIFWYSSNTRYGRRFMMENFPDTFENKKIPLTVKKPKISKSELKARSYFAVATAKTREEAFGAYLDYMNCIDIKPMDSIMDEKSLDDYKLALLVNMIVSPSSKGGRMTANKYSSQVRREWQAKGGRISKRGLAR